MATREAPIHENVKRKLVESGERDTALIFRSLRNTARIFRNSIAEEVMAIEGKGGATIEDMDLADLARLEAATDVVQIDDDRYCVMNTPPWIKYASYINWLQVPPESVAEPAAAAATEKSIAVPPFADFSPDGEANPSKCLASSG